MKDKIFLRLVREKISRREFLVFLGKSFCGLALIQLLPFKKNISLNEILSVKKRFSIPQKQFRREDLYRNHKLAG